MMSEYPSDFEDNDNITIRAGTPPAADVIFLSTHLSGTRGTLNSLVLDQLGLDTSLIPKTFSADRQYAVIASSGKRICFVVTLGQGEPASLLETNLLQALSDQRLADAKSFWIPLMGTGSAKLSFDSSRQIIVAALTESGWRQRKDVRITLSFPPDKLINDDVFTGLSLDDSVRASLEFAAALRIGYKDDDASISTTLLFFAFASSQRQAAPPELRADPSALLFSGAVQSLAGSRYFDVCRDYFPKYERSSSNPDSYFWPVHTTPNVHAVLRSAQTAARAAGRQLATLNDVIVALISSSQGRHRICMEKMGIAVDALLEEYGNAVSGEIGKALFNDVATLDDQLGYESYAEAIKDFLVDASTPPPISISIQAPWGAGKILSYASNSQQTGPRNGSEQEQTKRTHSADQKIENQRRTCFPESGE